MPDNNTGRNRGPHYEEIHVFPDRGMWALSVDRYYGPDNTDTDIKHWFSSLDRAERVAREYGDADIPVIIHA